MNLFETVVLEGRRQNNLATVSCATQRDDNSKNKFWGQPMYFHVLYLLFIAFGKLLWNRSTIQQVIKKLD